MADPKPKTVSETLAELFEVYYEAYLHHLLWNYNTEGVPLEELDEADKASMIAGIKTMLGTMD